MSRKLVVRGVPDDVAIRLERVSRSRGQSVSATVNQILEQAVGPEQRVRQLQRYVTWGEEDLAEFSAALASQRRMDVEPWR